ncbi:MAG: PaREP1 family protein [Chloroflexi bacterium]|nr:PaREP1 family protein [Chloroflexota bacterium]
MLDDRDLSAEYLEHARSLLAEGDLKQASEKGWGAAATSIKALAESRGLDHNGHFLLRRILRQLVEEIGDDELSEHFGLAEVLHINFYEGRLPSEDVERYVGHVERLAGRLGELS